LTPRLTGAYGRARRGDFAEAKNREDKPLETTNPAEAAFAATPQFEKLELPQKLVSLAQMVGAQLLDYDNAAHRYTLKPTAAFTVCLAIAQNDPRAAIMLLGNLLDGVDDWNATLDVRPRDFPFP
jgi:hypothetical protein